MIYELIMDDDNTKQCKQVSVDVPADSENAQNPEKIAVLLLQEYMERYFYDCMLSEDTVQVSGVMKCGKTHSSWAITGDGSVEVEIERNFNSNLISIEAIEDNFDYAGEHPDQIQLEEIIGGSSAKELPCQE